MDRRKDVTIQTMEEHTREVLLRVTKALEGLEYGEVILKVQGGKVIWVDRYERERVG